MEDFYQSRALFRTQDILDYFTSVRSMQAKLKALIEVGHIAKIKNGLYATVNPLTGDVFASRFEIASALFENACVAYHSALEFHGLGNQMFSEVQVFTEKRNIPFEYNGLEYKFFSYTAKGGIMRLEQNAEIVVTDLERTVVDCIDRIDLAGGLEELVTALNGITHLDEQALLTYLKEYDKKFVYKKAGFLLSLLKKDIFSQNFFDICKQNCSIKLEDISEIYDYFEIDPQFGSKQDLQELVDGAHRRGMRIVLDAVFNHCSEKLPQFADVKEKGRRSAYFDWFLIDGDKPDPVKCNYQCFGFCNYMPKFNTSNPQVQEYLREIAIYWVKNFDIDGWRLDVSDEVSHDFWRVLRKAVKAVKPDCAIIGENWHDAHPFLCGDQYDGIMNYALTKACLDYFAYGNFGAKEFADKLNALYMRNSDQANRMMMNLLDSHDTHRFYSLSNKNTDALICGLSVIFMHPGAAGVYYGTEIPLEGGYDPDCRRAMDWNAVQGNTPVKEIISRLSKIRRHEAIRYGGVRFYAKDDVFVLERSHENKTLRLNISRHGGADIRQQGKILLCYNYKEKNADGFAFVIEEVS